MKQTPEQLQKTIKSFEKNVSKHEEWVYDPTSKVPHFGGVKERAPAEPYLPLAARYAPTQRVDVYCERCLEPKVRL